MAEKLSTVYKKFLYGGETNAGTSLYETKPGKKEPKVPALLQALPEFPTSSPISSPKALTDPTFNLITPKADDVPEVPLAQNIVPTQRKHKIEPVVQTFKVPGTLEFPGAFNREQFKKEIRRVESDGMGGYEAVAKDRKTGKLISSAAGAYQFLWNTWGESIGKVTGVKTKQAFLKNKEAQEKFMDHYTNTTILPAVNRLREVGRKRGLSDSDIGKLIHFQGVEGAKEQILSGEFKGKTKTNMSVKGYLAMSKG